MDTEKNKVLLLILQDGDRLGFALSDEEKPENQYANILRSEGLDEEQVKKNYYFGNTRYTVDQFLNFFDEDIEMVNEHEIAIDFKLEEFRKQRVAFFSILDLEFMKSIEEDCEECKNHVVSIKNLLRNMPFELSKKLLPLETEDVIKFNPFNNVELDTCASFVYINLSFLDIL